MPDRTTSPSVVRCSKCGEIWPGNPEMCAACGATLPSDTRRFERVARTALIVLLLAGALAMLGAAVREWLMASE